jgi:transcriptional regulator with XRE-family HTH domain
MECKTFEELLAEVPIEIIDKVNDDVSFTILIRDWLIVKQWTQKELAAKLDMKESQLSRILSGHNNLTLATIRRFERVLGERLLVFTQSPLEHDAPLQEETYLIQPKPSLSQKYAVNTEGVLLSTSSSENKQIKISHSSSTQYPRTILV